MAAWTQASSHPSLLLNSTLKKTWLTANDPVPNDIEGSASRSSREGARELHEAADASDPARKRNPKLVSGQQHALRWARLGPAADDAPAAADDERKLLRQLPARQQDTLCYNMSKLKGLPESQMKAFPDTVLFYMFYNMPNDKAQLSASKFLQ
eukprot:CAMPEP_0185609496 /NCGR_PEP_ID=MMETSP0436-20130131/9787_1 /TAXON_ID=626734 ORGANISM="Favella taraikaensis, Strain Fe Narragansett Bay" /NCGR_SAMPLE_ID=MMETSP0436 /ASSEMBLY_ACC=CAM_ASM_000390 /LENGTH=152 /DNA_ID=CAMNT_0028241919 /DNA_START=416 /DNA_END=876 /DNA_ORIENTATION=-